jgi:cytochrome c-type biogenesis protein CcsB
MAAIDTSFAHASDLLFTTAIAIYAVAMISYAGEYAFGRRGKVAATMPQRVLVPTGGPASNLPPDDQPPVGAGPIGTGSGRRTIGDRVGRFAVALTVVGLLVHGSSIALRGLGEHRLPWGNMYEFSAVMGFIAVLAFLIALARAPQIRYLGLFVMAPVLLVMFLAGTVLYAKAQPLVPALQSYWLAIHVSLAAGSEGILMVSAIMTTLFLIRQQYDKQLASPTPKLRFPISLGARMPVAEQLDKVAYRLVAFAFPLYTIGIICGAIWAEAAWGRYWGWDPKETWAFIAWVIYAAYLHARATAGWKGRAAAWINLLGFGAMTFNFFVVNILVSGLHSYAGLN